MAQPFRLLMLSAGVFCGLVIGAVPGIGGIFGMALLIPLTYHLDPYAAFALLLGMGSVTTTSDTIPAILFGVPGGVGAAATVLDGHAMARKGEAARAFGAAYMASLIGGVCGALVLAATIPVMRPLVLLLKSPDFFAICAFGLSMVAMLAGTQPLKGLAAAMLGLLLSFVGIDDYSGDYRWTFGQIYLWEGLPIVVVFLGLFGLPELASLLLRGSIQGTADIPTMSGMKRGMIDALREWPLVIRCSWIGALLGAVPGIGVAALDWIAYGHAARRPGPGPRFGEGNVRGVIAPESANNAKEGGSLIPTVAFGVPGSASMSILLGAFLIQGLVPGPDMLGKNASITISMVLSIALANIMGAVTCLFLTRPLASVARVPAAILIPIVVVFIVVGTYQTSMSILDFVVLMLIGMLGMAMKEFNWPRSAFTLGFVLGPSLEKYFFLSYQIAGWSWLLQPLVLAILGFSLFGFWRQSVIWFRSRSKARVLPPALPDAAVGGVMTAIALAATLSASRFSLPSGLFPTLTAGLTLVLSTVVTLQALARWRRKEREDMSPVLPETAGEWSPSQATPANDYLVILGLCIALAVLILLAGHLAGSAIFIVAGITALGGWRRSTPLLAAGTIFAVYAVFDFLVSQPWPRPWLVTLIDSW